MTKSLKVLIAGGGIGGMAAAVVAAPRLVMSRSANRPPNWAKWARASRSAPMVRARLMRWA